LSVHRDAIVLDLQRGDLGIAHLEEDDAVEDHRDVVLRDRLLTRDVDGLHAHLDEDGRVEDGDQEAQSRARDPLETPKAQHDHALPLRDDLHARREEDAEEQPSGDGNHDRRRIARRTRGDADDDTHDEGNEEQQRGYSRRGTHGAPTLSTTQLHACAIARVDQERR
jgi:hypothetical protein